MIRAAYAAVLALTLVQPACAGELPDSVATERGKVRIVTAAQGLEHPWGMAFLPDGRLLVTERPGRLRFVAADGKLSDPIGGLPPIAVAQHIPPMFSRIMAEHLNKLCRFEVREASDGDELRRGLCLVAPGDFHLMLVPGGRGYRARLTQSPPVHHCRPAVDVLFRSAAEHAGPQAVAVLLTGMGVDGARGMHALRMTGARTIVEHEESCVVYGMPQAAIKLGAAEEVVPLPKMPQAILQALGQPVRA